jgi:uncharacterized delta-60 repeat protein
VTIVNQDSQIQFSRPDYSVTENFVSGTAVITLTRVGSTNQPVSVDLVTKDDTATAGSDYGAVNSTITFAAGESSRTVTIPIFDDNLVEGPERAILMLTNLVGSGVIGTPTATLTILDDDFSAGQIEFTSSTYLGSEASGQIVVTLRRIGGTTGVISVQYATHSGGDNPAQAPSDYQEQTAGIVSFQEDETLKSFIIPVVNDQLVEGNETLIVSIFNPSSSTSIVGPTEATAIIVDDDLPSGSLDQSFDPGTGANGDVRVVKLAQDARILVGGNFTAYNGTNRSHIAEIDLDGALDQDFDPGVGPDGPVAEIEIDPEGKLIIGGGFGTVDHSVLRRIARLLPNGQADPAFTLPLGLDAEVSEIVRQPDGKIVIGGMFDNASEARRNHIARLNSDGQVDVDFNPGTGTDGDVDALALQPDGKILVGGSFAFVNGAQRRGIARLNSDGTLDTSFNTSGIGAVGGGVEDILLLDDGRIIIAGGFTTYNGSDRGRVAALKPDGTLDDTFNPGAGANNVIYAIARQSDGKFIIAGDFTSVAGVNRNRIARLNTDGTHDTGFKPGNGANDAVLSVAIQPDDGRILLGGRFTEVDNIARNHIARLNNDKGFITPQPVTLGSVLESGGQLQFTAATQAGFSYTLESASDVSGEWKQQQTVVAQGATTVFSVDPTERYQFFRIRREQ